LPVLAGKRDTSAGKGILVGSGTLEKECRCTGIKVFQFNLGKTGIITAYLIKIQNG